MELTLAEAWGLFSHAIVAALVAGLACPLVGCFLLVRRTGFYGVALPQLAACGMAFGYAVLPWWVANVGLAGLTVDEALLSPHALRNYQMAWAAVFTFGGLAGLALLGRGGGTEAGRLAATFAVAWSATILLAQASPLGAESVESLLRGEILTVDLHELETIVVAYLLVAGAVVLLRRDLLLASHDPDIARVLGRPVRRLELGLLSLVGLTVSAGVLVVGPVVLFGLLVVPPLAARALARSMASFLALAALLGLAAAVAGLWASFALDWPLGPSVCAAAALELPIAPLAARWREARGG